MPVSTRSQLSGELSQSPSRRRSIRNPHQGLKEKMKALTLLYEQHRQPLAPSHHPSIDLLDSNRKKSGEDEKQEQVRVKKDTGSVSVYPRRLSTYFPKYDTKENQELKVSDHLVAYTVPRKRVPITRAPARSSLSSALEGVDLTAKKTISEESEVAGGMGSRIMVFVRLRPMGKKEVGTGSRSCVRIVNKKDVYLTEFASEKDYLRLKRVRGRHFCFDASFPESTSQQEVYLTTTTDLVEGVLGGRNGSVFCYGATGAGKTYTMLGTLENPGVMVLTIKDLFSKIRQRSFDGKHSLLLSYLEVYNETVRDLLSPGRPLVLREDKQGTIAAGLTQYRAYSTDEVMQLLQQGNQNRTTEPTRANETSSRSHAILQIIAEYQVRDSVNVVRRVGKLSLIDLAGSERALATDLRTQRSIEGANINRSLLALSSCINALVEGKKHIPYRNSKLTQLLKDSLGGPCNTVMIANISPSHLSFGETQNTLHWADRAKEIRTKACLATEAERHIPESKSEQTRLILELQKENSELRQQAVRLQQKLFTAQAQAIASKSPQPLAPSTPLHSASGSASHKPKRSILSSGNCFGTPNSTKRETQELQKRVKELETVIEGLGVQLKQKDDFIQELIAKRGNNIVGKSTSLRSEELKSSSKRFASSPQRTTKKRSFWDSSAANSPTVEAATGRKTRSHVAPRSPLPTSRILPPGFAWTKQDAALRK